MSNSSIPEVKQALTSTNQLLPQDKKNAFRNASHANYNSAVQIRSPKGSNPADPLVRGNEVIQVAGYNTIRHGQGTSRSKAENSGSSQKKHNRLVNPDRINDKGNGALMRETIANLTVGTDVDSAELLDAHHAKQAAHQRSTLSRKSNSILMPAVKQKLKQNQTTQEGADAHGNGQASKPSMQWDGNATARRGSNTNVSDLASQAGGVTEQSNPNSMRKLDESGRQVLPLAPKFAVASGGSHTRKAQQFQKKGNSASMQQITKQKLVGKQYYSSMQQRENSTSLSINQESTDTGIDDFGRISGAQVGTAKPFGAVAGSKNRKLGPPQLPNMIHSNTQKQRLEGMAYSNQSPSQRGSHRIILSNQNSESKPRKETEVAEERYLDDTNRYTDFLANSQMAMLDTESNQLVPIGSKTFFGPNNANNIVGANSQSQKHPNQNSKQNKTRNNLQQHVISKNPDGKVQQAAVGEPYMQFRNQAAAKLSSKTQRKNESVDWKKSVYARKQQIPLKPAKQAPPPLLGNKSNQSSSEWLETINNQASARARERTGHSFNISIRENNATVTTQANGYQLHHRQLKVKGKLNNSELKYPALPAPHQERTQQLTNAYSSSKQTLTHSQKAKSGKMVIPEHFDLGQGVLEPKTKKSSIMMPAIFPDGKATQARKTKKQADSLVPTRRHNHTNSQALNDGSQGLLPGTNESIRSPSKHEYRLLKKAGSPQRAGDADYESNHPERKTQTEFPVSETGTHRQSYFQSHFTVTRDENEISDMPGTSDGLSTQHTQVNPPQKQLKQLAHDKKMKASEKQFSLQVEQNNWQVQRQQHPLYGTIGNMPGINKRAIRQKRLQDAYMHGSSKNLSPIRTKNSSTASQQAGVYVSQVAYKGPTSTISQTRESSNSNIRIHGENDHQNSDSEVSNAQRRQRAHNVTATAKAHAGFQSQQLKNFALKESSTSKLEPVLGRYGNKQSQIRPTETDESHPKSPQMQKGKLVGGSSFRDASSNSTLLVPKDGLSLGGSIEHKKAWKNSSIRQTHRVGKLSNVARNQSNHHYTTGSRDRDVIYEQLPLIKNPKAIKGNKSLSRKAMEQSSTSPSNKHLSPKNKQISSNRENQLINSSRIVNITAASRSVAASTKINTMDNFHKQSKASVFIRQSFNGGEAKETGPDGAIINDTAPSVERDEMGQFEQSEQQNLEQKSNQLDGSTTGKPKAKNGLAHTKSPHDKRDIKEHLARQHTHTMPNTHSMTSLPKIDSHKDLANQKHAGNAAGRRISQRVQSDLMKQGPLGHAKSTPRRHNIVKVSKLSNTRQSLNQQNGQPSSNQAQQSSLRAKEAAGSAFHSPKVKKQVTVRDEHELISLQSKPQKGDDEENDSIMAGGSMSHSAVKPELEKGDEESRADADYPQSVKHESLLDRSLKSTPKQKAKGEGTAPDALKNSSLAATEAADSLSLTSDKGKASSAQLLTENLHQIRIEIGKQEVLDSMSKEYAKDLSLLYYDFNNSTARLVSKQKKLSDFVIQEEAEELQKIDHEVAGRGLSGYDSPIKKNVDPPSPTAGGPTKTNLFGQQLAHSNSTHLRAASGPEQPAQDHHSEVNQSDFERVNRKIDKAKLSIGQLQQDGIGMGLQSPARLANSRNSVGTNSNKTIQTLQNQGATGAATSSALQDGESPAQTVDKNSSLSPSGPGSKGPFMFNSKGANMNSLAANRNNSPFFGGSSKGKSNQAPASFADRASQLTQQLDNTRLQQDTQMSQYDGTIASNASTGMQATQNGGGTGATELGANFATLVNQNTAMTMQSNDASVREESKTNYGGGGTGFLPMTGDGTTTKQTQNPNQSQQLDGNDDSAYPCWNGGEEGDSFDGRKSGGEDGFQSVLQYVKENPSLWQ